MARASRVLLRRPSAIGTVATLVALAASLVPGLLPRPWYVQGVVSGMAMAAGYAIGIAIWIALARVAGKDRYAFDPPMPLALFGPALVVAVGLVIWCVVIQWRWQRDIRELMGMESGAYSYILAVLALAPLTASILLLAGRGLGAVSRGLLALWNRRLSPRLAITATVVLWITALVVFFDVVVAGQAIPALEAAHHRSDTSFEPGVGPPSSPMRAGGPGSLVDWERMGRQGREFVTSGPSSSDILTFTGEAPQDPIRVYIGLELADTAEERAALAVAELERTGAFERELIVLVVPTGSGWIDPYAVEPLEYMHNGDTAAVAVQYSYLASWLVMLRNQDLSTEAAGALLEAVDQRVQELPEGDRPKLLLYGESLGSFGWERTLSGLSEVVNRSDGVLWVGPPGVNPLWRRLVADRDPVSPLWRPVYRSGATVRFGPDRDSLLAPEGPWPRPRVVYLQHASDPITWLSLGLVFHKPEWLDFPRGPDVSEHMPYLPIITYLQLALDLTLGSNAPLGHGHKFGPSQGAAWSLILPPPGWTDRDTEVLLTHLER